jgi:hypothetical protein
MGSNAEEDKPERSLKGKTRIDKKGEQSKLPFQIKADFSGTVNEENGFLRQDRNCLFQKREEIDERQNHLSKYVFCSVKVNTYHTM